MFPTLAPPNEPDRRRWRALAGLASVVLVAGAATACTGGSKDDDPGPDDGGQPAAVVPVDVKVTTVAGLLGRKARKRLANQVGTLLQSYADNAFLGEYPRTDFTAAFADFTKGAARDARRDQDLLTGAGFGDVESVTADALAAKLSVVAPGKAVGATARIRFDLEVDGQPVTYAGRLLLTPGKGGWQIFGYDVHRGDIASSTEGDG